MPQLKVENLYNTTITSVGGIPSSGDCDFTVAVAPQNTNGFIILSPDNPTRREIMYYHNVIGNRIYVRGENRVLPKAHIATETVKMNDVAEIFNTFSDMISQAFYVEKTGGLTIRVWGGYVYYNGSPVSVPDTNLTMTDNTTNYIKYNYSSNTFSVDTVNSGNIKAQVVTLGGVITSIGYRTAKESYIDFTVAITGALPPQVGNAGKVLTTDGTNVSWQDPMTNASTILQGAVEIATDIEVATGGDIGGTGAKLAFTPASFENFYYFGDGSDGDVIISSNTSLTRDMYYNNLTVDTGIVLNPDGYAIYVLGTLTLTGTAKIARNGNNGGNASGATAGAAATALSTNTCGPVLGGRVGATGNISGDGATGTSGVSVAVSYAATGNSVSGGTGGSGGAQLGGAGGSSVTHTQGSLYNKLFTLPIAMHRIMMPSRALTSFTQYGSLASSGSGGAGGSNGPSATGGGGGGSGGNGGIILIFANVLAGSGSIEARGGTGGNGGNAFGTGNIAGGGGGGGGGCGGIVYIVYKTGTLPTINLTGGTGGIGGTGYNGGASGISGSTGTTGTSIILIV